ncbi:MmgE/PrpD family [Pannonibacter phragmitetus]|uniref:MmgE/PrpD family n=1 Tax=Pannonibacter phragmitetus TaxID=121719 RepID=A0A378ZY09_9HYPH|nr:MmgE/PrpD family protein [Pannonibacter phragmitetus]SUB02114.1 MmgE/PrpD family [Pannonibacter phragmitetus]
MQQTESEPVMMLSRWAAGVTPADTGSLMPRAAEAFADTLACMHAGCDDAAVLAALTAARAAEGPGRAPVYGHDVTLSPAGAALVNATAAHALDYDDNFAPGITHASAVLVPALSALCSTRTISGARLLSAYTVGLELHARISSAVNPDHYGKGWHATSTVGTIGTAGAAAWLLGLDAYGIARAMSLGFSQAAGSKLQFGSDAKPLHAGLAARAAVLSALLAEAGLGAQPEFMTGPWGFVSLYGGTASMDLGGLGSRWALAADGLMVKRFPCCAASHKALDAAEILHQQGIAPDHIAQIAVHMPELLARNLRFDTPVTGAEGRFSLSYPMAALLTDGELTLRHFSGEGFATAPYAALMQKIRRIPFDPGSAGVHAPYRIEVSLTSGKTISIIRGQLCGAGDLPLSAAQMGAKIHDCLAYSGRQDAAGLFTRIAGLAGSVDAGALLSPETSGSWVQAAT